MNYNLYTDVAGIVPRGNTGTSLVNATGTGNPLSYSVYGQVPAQTTPSAGGNYTDTVTISVVH